MNKLIIAILAALGVVLVMRRQTLREDSQRMRTAATDASSKVTARVKGESQTAGDLLDDAGDAVSDAADDTIDLVSEAADSAGDNIESITN